MRGGAVWQLVGLITRRSWVQILPPLPVKYLFLGAARPFFYGVFAMKDSRIVNLIQPAIESLGFELWGCDYNSQGNYTTLRVYVDGKDAKGITLDECAIISREIGAILDVENLIGNRYHLEVSSPGIDRFLFTADQFKKYIGEIVKIKLYTAQNDRRQFEAEIIKVEDDRIFLKAANEIITILLSDIQKARLKLKI